MSDQTEPGERTANEPTERLTFAQAGERLNISTDAVRMRVRRGTLVTIRANDQTFVLWPQPERTHDRRTRQRTRSERRAPVPEADRVIARVESENAFLRAELASRTEEIRRRDHIIAGLVERVKEIPATNPDTPRNDESAPLSADPPIRAPEPSQRLRPLSQTPVSDTLALGWRRWWRRITGAGH